jgi:hypothetical protein
MFNLTKLLTPVLFLALSAQAAQLHVVYQQQQVATITHPNGAKLEQFYAQVPFPENVDWQSALISNAAEQKKFELTAQQLQAKLIKLEALWVQQNEINLAQSLRQLKRELFQLPLAGRIHAQLDPDRFRLSTTLNRPLIGEYTLYTAPHRQTIHLVGLINSKASVPLHSGWSIEQYVSQSRLAGADNSYGYLVAPNGEWQKVPLAYWNKQHIEPAPSSTLFIGFAPALLPENMADLNELIAEFIANRIPQ